MAHCTNHSSQLVSTSVSYLGDLDSNLGPETGYPEHGFLELSSVPPVHNNRFLFTL
jgi:hypothetical protein